MASLASDGIPMEEGSVEETRGINVAEGVDKLENTRDSVIVDEGKNVNCKRYLMESGENYSKPLEEFEQENSLKDADLKETSREDEDKKSNSLNVIDDAINFEHIPIGETTDMYFENGVVSQYFGEKKDEKEKEDSLDNEEALKMPQNEHRNEFDESDSTSIEYLVPQNSSKEFTTKDSCEGDHLHQSDKIEKGEIEDVQVIENTEGNGTDQDEDNAIRLPIQDNELQSDKIEKGEIEDVQVIENTEGNGTDQVEDNAMRLPIQDNELQSDKIENGEIEDVQVIENTEGNGTDQVEDNAKRLPIQDNELQSDKIEKGKIEGVQVIESMEGKGTDQVEGNAMRLPIQDYELQSDKIEERGEIEDVQVIESMEGDGKDQVEDTGMGLPIQDNEIQSDKIDEKGEIEDVQVIESMEGNGIDQVEDNAMGLSIQDYELQSDKIEEKGEIEDVQVIESMEGNGTDQGEDNAMRLPIQDCELEPPAAVKHLEPEETVDTKSLESIVSETQNAIKEYVFQSETETKSSLTETDTPRFETQSNEYDGENIHVDTQAGLEFSALLASESSSLEPQEIVDQKSLDSTVSDTQNAVEEDIFHHEPESKNLQMQTDTSSYVSESNENDGEKINANNEAKLESPSMLESESFSAELVDQKSLESTASETQNVIEEDIFHCEPETERVVMQTDASSFETKSNVFDAKKIHADTDNSLVFSSMLESESSSPFTYVEDPSRGLNRGHDPKQEFGDSDLGLEIFSTPESNSLSIPTDNEDFIAESTEDDSYITTKSDTFSVLHENIVSTKSQSTEDTKFVSRKDEEIDDFDRTIGREALSIDQSLEMHDAEAKNGKDMECEATDRDVNLVKENGEDANEAEDIDSNANTWPEECEEESLSLQVNTDLVSAVVIDKDQGNSNLDEENSPVGESVTVSATEYDNQQSHTAEEEPVLVSGQDRTQTAPESGAAYNRMINRQELPSDGPNAICEQSMLEQQQPCLPLLPLGEEDSLGGSDQNEKQQKHMETVELSFATNEPDLVPYREGIEPVELPLASDEKSQTNDCDQLEESPVIEKTDDAMREATDTGAANDIQQYAETVESSVVINETNDIYKEGSENVLLRSQIDETEGISNECFKAVERLCAIDETKGGVGAEAPSDEQQPNEMIEERSVIEKLPEAVRDYQGQIKSIFLSGSEDLPKSISLDKSNIDDGSTIILHGNSSSTVQGGAQINGGGVKAGETDFVDKAAAYTNDDDESSIMKKVPAKAVSQTSVQGFEALRMDEGLTENILVPDQRNEDKLQLQINEVMAKTASEMLLSSNSSEPTGAIAEEQFTIPSTEVPKNSSPTSSFGAFLTHKGQESQDLQTFEVDNKASVREKVLSIHADKRASIWDCCGFWNLLHDHED